MRLAVFPILAGFVFALSACTHVIKRPIECGPRPAPVGRSAIGWQRVPRTRAVNGSVITPGSLDPIQAATVSFTPVPIAGQPSGGVLTQYSDASGRFHIDAIPPARYVMLVRRLGYLLARDTVVATPDSGIVTTAILVPDNMILEECGMMYEKVRVPWWVKS